MTTRTTHRHTLLATDAENEANCARYLVYACAAARAPNPDSVITALAEQYRKAFVDGVLSRDDLRREIGVCDQCFTVDCEADPSHHGRMTFRRRKAR